MPKPSDYRSKQATKDDPTREHEPDLRLWAKHREESVFFQREAQVNLWTVLGGLALAALLTQLSPLLKEIQNSRWYLVLFFLSSVLIIASSWVQTAWGSLVLKWPISILGTLINLFGMFAQAIQCLLVTNPAGWLLATAGIVLFVSFIQIYFERSGARKVFSDASKKRFKITDAVYWFFLVVCLGGAYQLYYYPSATAEEVWGFVVFTFSILALVMQHKGMQQEKKELGIP